MRRGGQGMKAAMIATILAMLAGGAGLRPGDRALRRRPARARLQHRQRRWHPRRGRRDPGRPARGLPGPLRRQHDRRDRQRHHLRRDDPRRQRARAAQGGTEGQTAGDVFVSGGWGTLTFGDTNGADEQWVGDVPGDFSLTGLTDIDETRFVSNGGSFGDDAGENFAAEPARAADAALRLRLRRVRRLAVVEPRPDRRRRRRRLRGRLRRRQLERRRRLLRLRAFETETCRRPGPSMPTSTRAA